MISIKKVCLLCVAVLGALALSCSNKTLSTSAVNYLSGSNGTVTMRAIGTGSNQQDAINDAGKNAINVLLFSGLPESEQKTALIGTNQSNETAKHKQYFEKFYNDNRYSTFIMSSIPVSDFTKQNGGAKSLAVDIKVNLVALRNDLEQNNIIRKFGF